MKDKNIFENTDLHRNVKLEIPNVFEFDCFSLFFIPIHIFYIVKSFQCTLSMFVLVIFSIISKLQNRKYLQ